MKKLVLYIFVALIFVISHSNFALAEEEKSTQDWEDMLKFDREWQTNHEAVTDDEFEKVMQQIEKRKHKKKVGKYEFEADEDRDLLNDMKILTEIDNHSPTILFPTNLRSYEGEYIPSGYYKLNFTETDNERYITVSQGRKIYAKLLMADSKENFDKDTIRFAEIIPVDEEKMKLIYGNVDLNLEKILYIVP